jgi:hypothetical protein
MNMRPATIGSCLATLLLTLLGCGNPGISPTFEVTGKVTYKGQPVDGVKVVFTPDSGRPATGTTDSEGRFTLSTYKTDDGAVPGTHKVAIVPVSAGEAPPMPDTPEAERASPPKAPFPSRYCNPESSGLTATVESDGQNDFTFDMQE